jgi:hypothetical protein
MFLEYKKFNSIQFFVIYVPSQQLRGQLQTQHSVGTIQFNSIQFIDVENLTARRAITKLAQARK